MGSSRSNDPRARRSTRKNRTRQGSPDDRRLPGLGPHWRADGGPKTAFPTQGAATAAAEDRRRVSGADLAVYQCDFCQAWHMGRRAGRRGLSDLATRSGPPCTCVQGKLCQLAGGGLRVGSDVGDMANRWKGLASRCTASPDPDPRPPRSTSASTPTGIGSSKPPPHPCRLMESEQQGPEGRAMQANHQELAKDLVATARTSCERHRRRRSQDEEFR